MQQSHLGYRFVFPKITVREASADRFIHGIAGRFTEYKRSQPYLQSRHQWVTAADAQQVFLEDLNEKITGAVTGNRRYGWLFYFSEINDLELLHRCDAIIRSFFARLPQFARRSPSGLKTLVKAYYVMKAGSHAYAHDYDSYATVSAKLDFLVRRGYLDPARRHVALEIERVFERVKSQRLLHLEADVGTTS